MHVSSSWPEQSGQLRAGPNNTRRLRRMDRDTRTLHAHKALQVGGEGQLVGAKGVCPVQQEAAHTVAQGQAEHCSPEQRAPPAAQAGE